MNELIANAAMAVLEDGIDYETRPYYCLKFVREVVEAGLGLKPREFYNLYHTHTVEENTSGEPWARDLERSFNRQGRIAKDGPKAGDLVFTYRIAKPYGHVGVMLTDTLVIENAGTPRGFSRRFDHPSGKTGYINVVRLADWFEPTTVVRL